MRPDLKQTSLARLPAVALPRLAGLRIANNVMAAVQGDRLWIRWQAGDETVLRCLHPIPGVELFARCGDHWYGLGCALPAFAIAELPMRPLCDVLFPDRLHIEEIKSGQPTRVQLRLAPNCLPRPTTGMLTTIAALARWAERATTAQLSALRAAQCGDDVLVRGEKLPIMEPCQRFWGEKVLVPIGFELQPDVPSRMLHAQLGLGDDELLLVKEDGFEAVPESALEPLQRAGLRIAAGGVS